MENFVECSLDSESLFDDGRQHIDRDGNPDLGFQGVLGSTIERLDSKILFDPFEEQLDLPAALEKQSNRQGWQNKVVRQKNKATVFFDIEKTDPSKWIGIELRGFGTPVWATIERGSKVTRMVPCK